MYDIICWSFNDIRVRKRKQKESEKGMESDQELCIPGDKGESLWQRFSTARRIVSIKLLARTTQGLVDYVMERRKLEARVAQT